MTYPERFSRRRASALLAAALASPLGSARAGAQSGIAKPVNAPPPDAPRPLAFPADSGPHDDAATEWWYYTGHLATEDGDRYGFEFVIFRARRGDLEGYVSHFAVTDAGAGTFQYDQRIVGPRGVRGDRVAMDLAIDGWSMLGEGGRDELRADLPGYGIDLALEPGKPAALHQGDGYIDYGNGTHSWYYSRTRMPIAGVLRVGDEDLRVTGAGWMDHQWGNFTTFEDGGWDWYAIQLQDEFEVMLYVIHDGAGRPLMVDGSIVDAAGTLTVLGADEFRIDPLGTWTSPETGVTWPQGWEIAVAPERLALTVTPVLPDQELDTRFSTGIIYWEGACTVSGSKSGEPIGGDAYVELTGYAPVEPVTALGSPATPVAPE